MNQEILELVADYLNTANQAAELLRREKNVSNVLSAVNTGIISREGEIISLRGDYFVHGTGCRIDSQDLSIDFDFGPNGSIPGFDPWKLYDFARSKQYQYGWLPNWSLFRAMIDQLLSEGILYRLGCDPSPHLLSPAKDGSASETAAA